VLFGGAAVSWRAKQQSMVATSTCHAEYIALCETAREVIWLRMMLEEIGFILTLPSEVLEDNAAAKNTAESIGVSDANKHIRVKWHYVRQCVLHGSIRVKTVASRDNPADALTKSPTVSSLDVLFKASGLHSLDTYEVQGAMSDEGG
jgi:hypothetical protein